MIVTSSYVSLQHLKNQYFMNTLSKFFVSSQQTLMAACVGYFTVAFARIRKSDLDTIKSFFAMRFNLFLIGIY